MAEHNTFYEQRRDFAVFVEWTGDSTSSDKTPPFTGNSSSDAQESSQLAASASFKAKAAKTKPWKNSFVEVANAKDSSSLHKFCLEDGGQNEATSASKKNKGKDPHSTKRLTEEEINEIERIEAVKPPRTPADNTKRLTSCANTLGTLFRQTHADHVVAHNQARSGASQANLEHFYQETLSMHIREAWDGEQVSVVEHYDGSEGYFRANNNLLTYPISSSPSTGKKGSSSPEKNTKVLMRLLQDLQAEAKERTNSVFSANLYASLYAIEAPSAQGSHNPRVVDAFAGLSSGIVPTYGTSPTQPQAPPPPFLIGSSNGPGEKRAHDVMSEAAASGEASGGGFQRRGSMTKGGKLGRRGSGNFDSNTSARIVEQKVPKAAKVTSAARRVVNGESGAKDGVGADGAAAFTSSANELTIPPEEIEMESEYTVKHLRLIHLKDENANDYLLRHYLNMLADQRSSNICLSLYVHQECTTVPPRTGAIRFFNMATADGCGLPARDRGVINHYLAHLLRNEPLAIPSRWLGHRTMLHMLSEAVARCRSHTIGVFHCLDSQVFNCMSHIASCGNFEVDVMIAQTHLDVQNALQTLLKQRDTFEKRVNELSNELDELGYNLEEQSRSILKHKRQNSEVFASSFATVSHLSMDQDLEETESMEFTANTILTDNNSFGTQGQQNLTLGDLGAKAVEEDDTPPTATPILTSLPQQGLTPGETPPPMTPGGGNKGESGSKRRKGRVVALPSERKQSRTSSPTSGKKPLLQTLQDLDESEKEEIMQFFEAEDEQFISAQDIKLYKQLSSAHGNAIGASNKKRNQMSQSAAQAEAALSHAKKQLEQVTAGIKATQATIAIGESTNHKTLEANRTAMQQELDRVLRRSREILQEKGIDIQEWNRKIRDYEKSFMHSGSSRSSTATASTQHVEGKQENPEGRKKSSAEEGSTTADGEEGGSSGTGTKVELADANVKKAYDFMAAQPKHVVATQSLVQVQKAHQQQREILLHKIQQEETQIKAMRAHIEEKNNALHQVHLPRLLLQYEFCKSLRCVLQRHQQGNPVVQGMMQRGDFFETKRNEKGATLAKKMLVDPVTFLIARGKQAEEDEATIRSSALFRLLEEARSLVRLEVAAAGSAAALVPTPPSSGAASAAGTPRGLASSTANSSQSTFHKKTPGPASLPTVEDLLWQEEKEAIRSTSQPTKAWSVLTCIDYGKHGAEAEKEGEVVLEGGTQTAVSGELPEPMLVGHHSRDAQREFREKTKHLSLSSSMATPKAPPAGSLHCLQPNVPPVPKSELRAASARVNALKHQRDANYAKEVDLKVSRTARRHSQGNGGSNGGVSLFK